MRDKHMLVGQLNRGRWFKMTDIERQGAADKLATNLQARLGLQNAEIYAYKDLAVTIEFGVARVSQP